MNKILIVYASKNGTTEKCAYKLANILKLVEVVNLNSTYNIDLDDYETIIIGSNIRMKSFSKRVKKFIKDNRVILLNKKVAYFICCAYQENKGQYFDTNIPKDLLEKAIIYDTFGGEIPINKCNLFDKMLIKSFNDKQKNEVKINQDNIKTFAQIIISYNN